MTNRFRKNRRMGGGSLKLFVAIFAVVAALGVFNFNTDSLAWQATSVMPSSGPIEGGTETTILGDFEFGTKITKVVASYQGNVVALDDQGQIYTWGYIDKVGIGQQNVPGECTSFDWETGWTDHPELANIDDCLGAGDNYIWYGVDQLYTPQNVNQAAAGDIGPSTAITDIFVVGSTFFALDDQGQLYVWGEGGDLSGLGGFETCDYTNYTNQADCENNDGDWSGDYLYAPISINRIAAGGIGPNTRIQRLYGFYWGEVVYAIDDQGQLYGWGKGNFGDGQGSQTYDTPVNINKAAAGDITVNTVVVDVVTDDYAWGAYVVDADGQIYVWGDAPSGMGINMVMEYYCFTKPQYTTQYDCENNGGWWVGFQINDTNDPNIPTSINAAAAGAITLATKIVDVEYESDVAFAIDDQGQLYVWSLNGDYMLGLGSAEYCDDSTYDNQVDCETAGQYWNWEYYETNNVPVNINQVAAGSIGPDTVIESVYVADNFENVFALDGDGQLHAWGRNNEFLPLGKDYNTTGYCILASEDFDNRIDCQNDGGYWYEGKDDVYVPVNVNQVAAGDITATTHIDSVNLILCEGVCGVYALDDNGQMYVWGDDYDGSMGLGNPCSVAIGYPFYSNSDQISCESSSGVWDSSRDRYAAVSTPINLNQLGGSVITNLTSQIVSVGYSAGEGIEVMFAVDSDGYVYAWGQEKDHFGVSACSIEENFVDDEEDCLGDGGTWDQSKYLDDDDYSSIIINKSRTGDLGPADYQVFFGGVASPKATTVDAHTLKAVTPLHAVGRVDVVVTDGVTSSTLAQAFDFYDLFLDMSVDADTVPIGGPSGIIPTLAGVFGSATNTVTVATNNPKGYTLDLSTDQPSLDAHASDLVHQSLPGNYFSSTTNACTWSDGSNTLINTTNPLSNNTYGFTLDPTSLSAQKLCQIPNSTTPLTVKSTLAANETGDVTTIYYGAKVNLQQLAGEYRATIIYTALANP
jgi:alpha-tubulin suppressor-like RCC1 family protein